MTIGRRVAAAPALSLRHTRTGVLVHEEVLRKGVIPALAAAEARVEALERLRDAGLLGRLAWLLIGRLPSPPTPKAPPDAV